MNKQDYLRVWDSMSCGNTYTQFRNDCQEKGFNSISTFPVNGDPSIAIAAETQEILESSTVYKELFKLK